MGITWVVLVMGSSSCSGCTGYVEFSWTWSVESLRGCGETGGLHVGELVGEDCSDHDLVVGVTRKVQEDDVVVDVGVFCRVNPREVFVLDEDWAMCR